MNEGLQTSPAALARDTPGQGRIFILNFHGIGTPPSSVPASEREVWIDRPAFETALDFISGRKDISITFDDGNESDHSIALPALLSRGLRAQFFIVSRRIGTPRYLAVDQVKELAAAGMGIGTHGAEHQRWAQLTRADLAGHVRESRERLESILGTPITRAACPYGSYNRSVINVLSETGFRRIYTSDGGSARPEHLIQPRNSVYHPGSLEQVSALAAEGPSGTARLCRAIKLTVKRWR